MSTDTDLQSWPEVPSIAHFCSLFREAFHLFEFDIQEFEESLLLLGADDESNKLVHQLVIKLLQGCLPMYRKRITQENYSQYLKQLLQTKSEEALEEGFEYRFENPFVQAEDKEYGDLDLKEKVLVLNQLCEFRLEAPDVAERVKNLDAASLRVEPLGVDSEGTTLWYFYGTRLYREDPSTKEHSELKARDERKKKKKHKKEKKKKRKKSREYETESSDEELEPSWSVACLSEEDWENLVLKYKESREREDRKLYRLLNDSFLPEIKEMFVEKEKEEKVKMQLLMSRRSSSRVEVLKKTQEERDRQLALQLAEEASKQGPAKGKRGRKRKNSNLDEDETSTDILEEREERAKQREMMKEMRARRAAEKMVEAEFGDDVVKQKSKLKEVNQLEVPLPQEENKIIAKKSKPPVKYDEESADDALSADDAQKTKSEKYSSPEATPPSSRDTSPDSSDSDSDDVYRPPREQKPPAPKTNFTNALIKAGSKSTKDSTLEKEKQKTLKELMIERPIVRKTPGLLLQTAGKGLLNKNKELKKENGETDLISLNPSSGISFGLWGGHLPVDQSAVSNSLSSGFDDKPFSLLSKDKKADATKKVFSNWGGDFFKKNLDFRANTNKILEKMQLSKSAVGDLNGTGNGSVISPNGNGIS